MRNNCTKSEELGLDYIQEEFFGALPEGRENPGLFITNWEELVFSSSEQGKEVLENLNLVPLHSLW